MNRPLPVTIICFIYIIAGAAGIIYHAHELSSIFKQSDVVWIFLVRILAIVGGIYAWRGANWARWILVAWIGYHVYISIGHEIDQFIMHAVIFTITVAALFNRASNRFFARQTKPD